VQIYPSRPTANPWLLRGVFPTISFVCGPFLFIFPSLSISISLSISPFPFIFPFPSAVPPTFS
jgi:hypothetical protein